MIKQPSPALHSRLATLALIIIVVWGAWLRVYALDHQSLWLDEGISALVIEEIAEKGIPLLDSGKLYYPGKPHTYIAAIAYKLFGKDAFALRLVSVFFGVATIVLGYFSCVILYRRRLIGLIAALLLSLNYLEIAWSRQIRFYAEYQFFFCLSLILFYGLVTRKKVSIYNITLLGLSGVLTVLLHMSGIMVLIPFGITALLYFQQAIKRLLPLLVVGICMISIFFLQYIFPTHDIANSSLLQTDKIDLSGSLTYLDHFILYFIKKHSLLAVSFFCSVCYTIFRPNRENILLLATVSIILIGLASQRVSTMRSLFVLLPLLIYLSAHLITVTGQMLAKSLAKLPLPFISSRNRKSLLNPAVLAAVFLAVLGVSVSSVTSNQYVFLPQKNYFLEHDPTYSSIDKCRDYTPQPDFEGAYAFIEKNRKKDDIFLVAFTALHQWYLPDAESYWLGFLFPRRNQRFFHRFNNKGEKIEAFVGMESVYTEEGLRKLMENHHGFVILDYYGTSAQVDPNIMQLLRKKAPLVYNDQLHPDLPWTRVMLGRF